MSKDRVVKGCGIDLSKLAPRGAKINNAADETTGAVSFMDLYSTVTGLIGQNKRRGALMLSLSCDHPDLEEFIDVKSDLDKITKANISVRLTDEFMQAVVDDTDYKLSFTREATGEVIEKTVKAREVFKKMTDANWRMAEPGALFWDRITSWNMLSEYEDFEYAGCNPCAEEPLPPYGACLLGSLNLSEFVVNPFTSKAAFDFGNFHRAIITAVEALNIVLDEGISLHPLIEQQNMARDWRQIGLGVMGVGDTLVKLGVRYGSEEAIDFCSEIGKHLSFWAVAASCELTPSFGTFPKCDSDAILNSEFIRNTSLNLYGDIKRYGLCNSQLLTIAPTGTLSSMLGISGGAEPLFAKSYQRKTESLHGEDRYYTIYTPIIQQLMEHLGISNESELPDYVITAPEIPYQERIAMQAAWQEFIDASISSTINVPEDFTKEQVFDLYIEAWEAGLKGVTVYRQGCEREGILTVDDSNKKSQIETKSDLENKPETKSALKRGEIIEVSEQAIGKKRKLTTGCGSLHCAAFFDRTNGDLLEIYLSKGSQGGCANYMTGLSRMLSLSARSGCDIYTIVDQLNSTGTCPSYAVRKAKQGDTSKGSCCPMAVGNALLDMWQEIQDELSNKQTDKKPKTACETMKVVADEIEKALYNVAKFRMPNLSSVCPECGEPLKYEGGCVQCMNCGYSKCD